MLSLNEKEHKILQELAKRDECRCDPTDQEVMGLVQKGFVELMVRVTMAGFKEVGRHIPKREANDNAE